MKKKLVVILIAAVLLSVLVPMAALADNSGWYNATGYNDNSYVGSPGNAYVSDDSYAVFDFHGDYVDYTFGNNIVPSTAIIQGIQVQLEANRGLASTRSFDVSLLDSGRERGTKSTGGLSRDDQIYTLGGTSNTWGYNSWTADKINNSLEVRVGATWGTFNCYLDQIQLKVTYTLPTTTTTVSSSDNDSTYGQSVTFTAKLNPSAATGTVQFKADGSSIGSASVSGGVASITTSGLSAGSHTITAEYGGSSLYQASSGTCSQTVSKADADIDVSGVNVPYDGDAHGAIGTATGADGSDLSSKLDLGETFTNVPGGTANWSFAGDANHNPASGSVSIVISQADADIDVDGVNVTYDGLAHSATGTATGADGSDMTSLLSLSGSFTNVPGGTATWSFAGDANHKPASGSVDIVINKAPLTVTSTKTITYGDAIPAYTPKYSGFVKGENKNVLTGVPTLACAYVQGDPVGDYTIYVGIGTLQADNYEITPADGALTVKKALLTVTADNLEITYGDAKPALTYTITGYLLKDDESVLGGTVPKISCAYDQWDDAGSYPIDVKKSTLAATNYGFKMVDGTLTVKKLARDVTVVGSPINITYGDPKPAFTYMVQGFEESEWEGTISGAAALGCDYDQGDPVNDYEITVDVSAMSATNFSFRGVNGTLKVNKAQLDVVPDDFTITYGDAAPAYTADITGYVNGDDEGDLTGALAFHCTYAAGKPVSTYGIRCDGLDSGNYAVTFHTGLLTVNKAALTVTADNKVVTFLDPAPAYTVQYSGFVAGDDAADLGGTLAYECAYASGSAIGKYDITPKGLTSDNYDITNKKGTLTVSELILTVRFADYNGTVLKTEQVGYGYAATAPTGMAREGYNFIGWDTSFNPVKTNLTVTAQYAIKTYTVSFFRADGVTQIGTTQTVSWGSAALFETAPARDGYGFDRWVLTGDDDAVTTSLTNVRENITADASYLRNGYTVTFVDYEDNVIGTDGVLYGGAAEAPDVPEREGYDFIGWDTEFDPVTSNLTVTAMYRIKTFTVTFMDADGNVISTQTVDWNTAAEAPDAPERDGYEFTGWDGTFDAVKDNITIRAQYASIENVADEEIPDTDGVSDEDVPAAGGAGFAWWWIPIILGAAAVLFFLIFFVARKKKEEQEQE